MALSYADRQQLLAANLPESNQVRLELQDYLARTGMAPPDFARRINYARETVYSFLNGNYQRISSNDGLIRTAIRDFIAAHPIAAPVMTSGRLYETENVCLLRKYFYEALDHRRAYYVYGAPGTQKTYVLQHLIAELNQSEIAQNGKGRRAYYIYVRQGIRSLDLMKRVAESCGAVGLGTVDRILRNLRFDLGERKVLLIFDEAQHLSIECLETIRELLDQPPHCGLLFAGTHDRRRSLPARPWNWSNGVRASMPAKPCRAYQTKKPLISFARSWEHDWHRNKYKNWSPSLASPICATAPSTATSQPGDCSGCFASYKPSPIRNRDRRLG